MIFKSGTAEFLAELRRWETEGAATPRPTLTPEQEAEIERIAAADKVQRMRRVRELAPTWSSATRRAWRESFRALGRQFADAANYLDRPGFVDHKDDEAPAFLKTA